MQLAEGAFMAHDEVGEACACALLCQNVILWHQRWWILFLAVAVCTQGGNQSKQLAGHEFNA